MLLCVCVCARACMHAQLCPTVCDPVDCSPPDSSVHGILNTGVGCHALLQGIFLIQGSNLSFLSLLHWQADFLPLYHLGRPSVQFSSVAQLCPTLCDPMNRSMPGLPVYHQLPESTQTHVHRVGDAIQPSHPLSSPSPPAINLSQHQGLFK